MPYDAHDTAVMMRINRHITRVNQTMPKDTVAEKLEAAWSANIKEREGDSTDTVGRDSDYYFAARHEIAKCTNDACALGKSALGAVGTGVYNTLKAGAEAVGHPDWTRTDPDKPNAPVGGFTWMRRGTADAYADVAHRVGDVRLHFPAPDEVDPGPRYSPVRRGIN